MKAWSLPTGTMNAKSKITICAWAFAKLAYSSPVKNLEHVEVPFLSPSPPRISQKDSKLEVNIISNKDVISVVISDAGMNDARLSLRSGFSIYSVTISNHSVWFIVRENLWYGNPAVALVSFDTKDGSKFQFHGKNVSFANETGKIFTVNSVHDDHLVITCSFLNKKTNKIDYARAKVMFKDIDNLPQAEIGRIKS